MLLVGSGVIVGALFTSIVVLGISYLSLEPVDSFGSETAEWSESSNGELKNPRSTLKVESRKLASSREGDSIGQILRLESVFDQSAAIHALLSSADEERVLDLIGRANEISRPSQRDAVLEIIFLKYAEIDSGRAFNEAKGFRWSTRSRLYGGVFRQWARSDLEAAVLAAKSLNQSDRDYASSSILYARDDLSLDRLYAISDELQNRTYMDFFGTRLWRSKARRDPRTAWHNALDATTDASNRAVVLTTVAEEWVEKDGIYVLDEIKNSSIAEYQKTKIYKTILGHIAETDPEDAISAATLLGLSPNFDVVAGIFSKWAEEEPFRLFGLADSLDPRFASTAKHEAIQVIAKDSPQKALALLGQINNFLLEQRAVRTIAIAWAAEDPKSALAWYADRELRASDDTLKSILHRLVRQDVDSAFNIVSAYPGERGSVMIDALFDVMGMNDIDSMKYFHRLEDEKKHGPGLLLGSVIALSDFKQALALGITLPDSSQRDYHERIIHVASHHNRFDLLESIDKLPTTDLRVHAVMELLLRNKDEALFSDKQTESLRSRLNTEQREYLDSLVTVTLH